MQFVRNVVDDLIEKRLWPVALVLAVLLVAVPVVLGSGGGSAADTGPLPAPAPAVDDGPLGTRGTAVAAQAPTTKRQDRPGAVRDPFKTLYAAKGGAQDVAADAKALAADVAKAAGGAAAAAEEQSPAASPTTPSRGGGSTGTTPSAGADTTPPKTKDPDPQDTYRVSFRFGETGEARTRKDVARLTPFPSEQRPYLIYLGLLADRKTAVFLLSSDVTADGEGACKPTKADCETVELQVGETEVLDVDLGGGRTAQYELELKEVDAGTASTKAVAARAHARASKAGRKIVQAARQIARVAKVVTNANAYRYDHDLGVLRREDPEDALGAHLPAPPAP